ncbi:hypothetical protein MYXO_00073 [Myxococcaceae bacterium]|jgi:hypothetical protein|nr:hypothetical protein MYXO_00073 [Myxococcaceae bacterium]
MRSTLLRILLFVIAAPATAGAFATFPDGSGGFLKWGDNAAGTPGGTVTWGFVPVGTDGSSYCGAACPGTSVSSIQIENGPGIGYTLTPLTDLVATFTAAFEAWAAAGNITFTGPDPDGGLAINDPGATSPDIRIGVFAFSSGGGAVGFAPPPNGGTGAGDILLDANSFYAFQPGNEGDAFPLASTAPNDIESLILHEIGHALGLAHPAFDGTCPVMQVEPSCLGIIQRELDPDDIAGVEFLYGVPIPEPGSGLLLGSGLLAIAAGARRMTSA